MKILVLGQMKDLQTGIYIVQSIEELGYEAGFVDIRAIVEKKGMVEGQQEILDKIDELDFDADIVIVLKGAEISLKTLTKIREKFKDKILMNWFFDVKMAGQDVWLNDSFKPAIEMYDYFLCSLSGVADRLQEAGFKNAYHVGEGCYPPLHSEQYLNHFQEQKYGEDIAFIGTVGLIHAHKNRIQYLQKILKEGFHLKLWGETVGDTKGIPLSIRQAMTGIPVINEGHSMVCQSTKINLGIDQDPTLKYSWSARLYRIMCAGGLYLSTATNGLEDFFKINKEGEEITKDQDLVVFYDEEDLVRKLDFLLEHDDVREAIRINGQKTVKENHTFVHRIKEIIALHKKHKR